MPLDLSLHSPKSALLSDQGTLVDLVDSLLDHGVVLRADLCLSVADVDLVFIGLDLVLSSWQKMQQDRGGA